MTKHHSPELPSLLPPFLCSFLPLPDRHCSLLRSHSRPSLEYRYHLLHGLILRWRGISRSSPDLYLGSGFLLVSDVEKDGDDGEKDKYRDENGEEDDKLGIRKG
jgi:hypothetical protein